MLLTILGVSSPAQAQEAFQYQRHYLSGKDAARTVDWDFRVSDGRRSGEWSKIAVPSNWELQGFGTFNYGHDHRNKERVLGKEKGAYRHTFTVPAAWKGKTVKVVFDGAMTDTEVKVNGKLAGEVHQGGFAQFQYDITNKLEYGKPNLLEVTVAKHSANTSVNKAEREADFWIFGGIFRPVYLEVLPATHFERVAVDARADGEFLAQVELNKVPKNGLLQVELLDPKTRKPLGQLQEKVQGKTSRIKGRFANIESWNPEDPRLYLARFSLLHKGQKLYEKEETIGFRTVELRPNDGFYVNGQRVVFKGVNRHSFYPTTGRALSEQNHLEDIRLMKEMNMNAVRMSHYPPDKRFLELCDSLGLFVLNEVTGWQDGYDTEVGPKIVKAVVLRDANHPSVVIWDHGNEGGWDFANEKGFHQYDIQQRPVIYPWLQRNKVDTHHYPHFNLGINRLTSGADVFMPTEFMHGLYDGGHGAGLDDFWTSYMASPLAAGGFLWVLADEAVLRADKGGVLDADGNHGPDGIVGPFRQKEGSFYTIKSIFSPVQVQPVTVSRHFDGKLFLQNNYLFTNLNTCRFKWKAVKFEGLEKEVELASGTLAPPDIAPGETRQVRLQVSQNFAEADLFSFTATDASGKELYTWTWPVKMPQAFAAAALAEPPAAKAKITTKVAGNTLHASAGGVELQFNLTNGYLEGVSNTQGPISLTGGPVPVGVETKVTGADWRTDAGGNLVVEVKYDNYPNSVRWKLAPSGLLHLEVGPVEKKMNGVEYLGISFTYPEKLCTGVRWIGKGPYRVWKNRLKGAEFGLWEKDYNNTITGHSTDSLIYPEFKGYHAGLYALQLKNRESDFKVYAGTPNLFFRLFTPEDSPFATPGVKVPFPPGDISFLYHIPAIGTKFSGPENMGPSSQKGNTGTHTGDEGYPISLWFDFRGESKAALGEAPRKAPADAQGARK